MLQIKSPCYLRIGRRASILLQMLLSGTIGVATAFVPSFELYMVLCFFSAIAVAGYMMSTMILGECLSPEPSGQSEACAHESP